MMSKFSNSKQQVLITGASGFIGSSLCCELCDSTYTVRRVVRDISANNLNCQRYCAEQHNIVVKDIGGKVDWRTYLRDIDVVVHLAGLAHKRGVALHEYYRVNRDATLRLARYSAESGVKRFIYLSSVGVFGDRSVYPLTESDIANPLQPYAISKYEAEQGLLDLTNVTKMEIVIIRPPLVYGPGAPGNFARLIRLVDYGIPLPFGAIKNKRSFVALDNLVDFILKCMDYKNSPKAANQIFLVSDDEDVSTTQLLRKVAYAFDKKTVFFSVSTNILTKLAKLIGKRDDAIKLFGSLQIDSRKAKELLDWHPVSTMDQQLRIMAKVFSGRRHD